MLRGFRTYKIVLSVDSEYKDALERWFISALNDIDLDMVQYNKECMAIDGKPNKSTVNVGTVGTSSSRYSFEIPKYDDTFDNIKYTIGAMYISFKYDDLNYSVELTDRMKSLLSNPTYKEIEVAEMIYNYSTIMPSIELSTNIREFSGQQWCFSDFERIIQQHGVNCEAFASPLNTYRTPKTRTPDPTFRYYSLFASDEVFGSSGSFLTTPITPGNYEVNPPFIESILELAAKKCIEILSLDSPSLIYFVGPAWRDANFVSILRSSKFYKKTNEGVHPYLHSGRKVNTKARSYNILLTNT